MTPLMRVGNESPRGLCSVAEGKAKNSHYNPSQLNQMPQEESQWPGDQIPCMQKLETCLFYVDKRCMGEEDKNRMVWDPWADAI
ncbi:hypothetical protein VNO77_15006 [Canavalia gladiata]|uniref:Uncharacterized protein n=1 Tax=Canavalia gladiata TaxID=3824 RepID=A0AAN9QVN5_CANGL